MLKTTVSSAFWRFCYTMHHLSFPCIISLPIFYTKFSQIKLHNDDDDEDYNYGDNKFFNIFTQLLKCLKKCLICESNSRNAEAHNRKYL